MMGPALADADMKEFLFIEYLACMLAKVNTFPFSIVSKV